MLVRKLELVNLFILLMPVNIYVSCLATKTLLPGGVEKFAGCQIIQKNSGIRTFMFRKDHPAISGDILIRTSSKIPIKKHFLLKTAKESHMWFHFPRRNDTCFSDRKGSRSTFLIINNHRISRKLLEVLLKIAENCKKIAETFQTYAENISASESLF